jgi:hypothetical protein
MKRTSLISSSLLIALSITISARAELSSALPESPSVHRTLVEQHLFDSDAASLLDLGQALTGSALDEPAARNRSVVSGDLEDNSDAVLPVPLSGAPLDSGKPQRSILQLPETPNSLALFLSGLLTLGVGQVVRSVKDFHLADLPAWYHAEAPDQIGHCVVFDLTQDVLVLCIFDRPVVDLTQSTPVAHWREQRTKQPWQMNHCLVDLPRPPPLA